MRHSRAAVLAVSLALAGQAAGAATLVYEGGFPTTTWGGPCSPCGTGEDRTFDRIDLGAAGLTLSRIDVAVHDITSIEGSTASGMIEALEIAIFDTSESLLASGIFTAADWTVIDVIDELNYTLSITLPNWLIAEQTVWISPFGVGGAALGLFAEGGVGDGVASQTTGDTAGFSLERNVGDLALRVFAGDPDIDPPPPPAPIPLPGGLPLVAGALALLGVVSRRRRA